MADGGEGSNEKNEAKTVPRGLLSRKGAPLASGARLPSLKGPRDLTLGGVKKKTFVPNLAARKEKSKDASSKKEKTESSRSNKKGERGQRGRGRGRNKPDFIQTQGSVFGEGPADRMIKRGSWGSGARESSDNIPKPRLNIKKEPIKVNKEEEDLKIKELLRDDFIDDPDHSDNDEDVPVILPLLNSSTALKSESKSEIKNDVFTAVEEEVRKLCTDDDLRISAPHSDNDFLNLLKPINDDKENLIFMKFPDSLPAFVPSKENEREVKSSYQQSGGFGAVPSTSDKTPQKENEEEISTKNESCTLSDLPEGFIGKLQITKSGKMRLKLGDIYLNVENGTQVGFLEDVVAIDAPEHSDRGSISFLGQVKQRVICIPEMESLMQQ